MKIRRYISLLLLAVYLFATGGPAYASLTCKCVAMHAQTAPACCHHCDRVHDLPAADADLGAPCCGDRHSTDINLYIGSASDDERVVRCAVTELPPLLAAACPCPAHTPALRSVRALPQPPLLCPDLSAPRALRAPPALV